MRKRSEMGVSGTVSALLTVLLLVAGFAVSTGLLSAIYSAQSEVLRKAVNVGEAVSERLQAFVYEDVRTNRTLLTVRNVGSVGSEVEYLMAVGYDGSVLAEARPGDTIKLGTQQAFTLFLSDLLGPGFDNYTEVRSRMATLYLKTVKGGVFGSGYMAPPSVMTAAYATSTTTISTTESSVTTLPIETGTKTITSWNATVILDNPDHWPVEAYAGVAFADHFRFGYWGWGQYWGPVADMDGFPNWGLQPGLAAKNGPSGSVTNVTSASQIKLPKFVTCWLIDSNSLVGWGGNAPVHKYSELGPTYINLRGSPLAGRMTCGDGDEVFDPRRTTIRASLSVFRTFTVTIDVRDMQKATFPKTVALSKDYYSCYGNSCSLTGYYVRHYFDLAYIKVVDLWNTTNVLAYVNGRDGNTVALRVDRPIGIAAVYVYSRTTARLPPPPPPPRGSENYCIDKTEVCTSFDADKIRRTSDTWETAPEGQCDGQVTVTFVREGGDNNCGAWIAPGSGTYTINQLQRCPENNGQITCTVPAGSTIIHGCARRQS